MKPLRQADVAYHRTSELSVGGGKNSDYLCAFREGVKPVVLALRAKQTASAAKHLEQLLDRLDEI